jgi:DNA-binding NtrC family response regulator
MTKQNDPTLGSFDGFEGISPAMRRVYKEIDACVKGGLRCLFLGPPGSGKELLAMYYYRQLVSRSDSDAVKIPYHTINCACLVDTLAISQLFGHVAGAFTDAKTASDGLFAASRGGVLFLDEIGDLPTRLDAALNRALNDDNPVAMKVGSSVAYSTEDVRVIAATEKPKDDLRLSLRDRFQVFIHVPGLDNRPEDAGGALAYFFEHAVAKRRRADKHFPPLENTLPAGLSRDIAESLRDAVLSRSWPGNFRSLRNLMDFSVMIASGQGLADFCEDVCKSFVSYLDRYSSPQGTDAGSTSKVEPKPTPAAVDSAVLDRIVREFPRLHREERATLAAFLAEQRDHLFTRDDLERESPALGKGAILDRLRRLRKAGLIVQEEDGRGELYRVTLDPPAPPIRPLALTGFLPLPLDVTWPKGVREDLTAIRKLLDKSRVVFMAGSPGVGKTVCAQALGTDLSRERAVFYYPFGDRGVSWFFRILRQEMETRKILKRSSPHDGAGDMALEAVALAEPVCRLFASEDRPVLILDNVELISDPEQEKALIAMLQHWGDNLSFVLVGKKLQSALASEPSLAIVEYAIMRRPDPVASEVGEVSRGSGEHGNA